MVVVVVVVVVIIVVIEVIIIVEERERRSRQDQKRDQKSVSTSDYISTGIGGSFCQREKELKKPYLCRCW